MSSSDDSEDDRNLFSGGLSIPSRTTTEQGKMIEEPSKQSHAIQYAGSSSDSDDEIVAMPSITNLKSAPPPSGPQLTATGSKSSDPVNLADDDFSDDSSSDNFDSKLAQRFARRFEKRNDCSEQSTQGHFMGDSSKSYVNSAHSNPSNGDYSSLLKERPVSSQETTYSIENRVRRLHMMCQENDMSSSESSSDEETDLARKVAHNDQHKSESAPRYASLDSDSDSDDSLLAASRRTASISHSNVPSITKHPISKEPSAKANEKKRAKEIREQARHDKQLAKDKEKEERQQQRVTKQAAAQAEKETRKRRRIESDQTKGKRANEEVAVLMEQTLCNHEELTLLKDLQESGFLVDSYPSGLGCDVVQFIRSDYVNGGAARAVEMVKRGKRDEYEHLPILGVVFHDPMGFISKIERDVHDEDDDYPKLDSFLRGLEVGWRAAWKVGLERRPRVIFYLNNVNQTLDKLWVKSRKKDRSTRAPPTGEELQDALIWLSVQFCVDCIHYLCPEDLSTQLTKMAVWLAREPYQRQMTDLECAKKTKMQCSDMDPPLVRSQDCWRRQLCQVPGISETMASSVVGYFPTMRSLYLRYLDPSLTESQKVLLLSDCFGREGRKDVKCSDAVYRILTSKNPTELI